MSFNRWLLNMKSALRTVVGDAARRRGKSRPKPAFRPWLETLEDRVVPSTITWTNRGTASDGFAAVFGASAATARADVDAALLAWQRLITDFRQNVAFFNPNNLDVTVSMDPNKLGFGGGAGKDEEDRGDGREKSFHEVHDSKSWSHSCARHL